MTDDEVASEAAEPHGPTVAEQPAAQSTPGPSAAEPRERQRSLRHKAVAHVQAKAKAGRPRRQLPSRQLPLPLSHCWGGHPP